MAQSENTIKQKRLIGIVAIAILIIVTILYYIGLIPFLIWILLDLVTAVIANLLLRRVSRRPL